MCGVIAVIGPGCSERVRTGLASMAHRGLRSRVSDLGWCSVGHVRLPIVGLGEAHDQPVERGRWTVAFVGEILDFRDRRPDLDCDVDLVADAWTEDGPRGFRDFDGFWCVVAADDRAREVHVLVDYLSQKPAYVREDRYALAVASEPDSVAALGPVAFDEVYLSACVKWGYCPETWRTPYVGIRRVRPGEHVILGEHRRSSWRVEDEVGSVPGTPEDLRAEVEAAVRRRVLSSDVPVACLVSGGLDSSVVYTLASRHGDVRAYHVENGESEACHAVAPAATQLDPRGVTVGAALGYMQEPIDLGSLLPQVALSDAVGRSGGERVCLTGDGADELFGGYGRASRYDSQASDVWHELVAWHLPRLDRVMMRNRVEVRSPFLARKVVQLALGLPREVRTDKRVLREIFRGDLPRGTADLPKRPLRTGLIESDREANSLTLVDLFRGRTICRG